MHEGQVSPKLLAKLFTADKLCILSFNSHHHG